MIVGNVDDPGAPADRQPAERHAVASVELALGLRPVRPGIDDGHGERGGAEIIAWRAIRCEFTKSDPCERSTYWRTPNPASPAWLTPGFSRHGKQAEAASSL